MPPKGSKRRKLESSVSEACQWKRLFFREKVYGTVESLVQAAVMGGTAKAYVEGLLQLGHRREKRKTLSDVAVALAEGSKPSWLTGVLSAVWLIYTSEVSLWKHQQMDEPIELAGVSKRTRKFLRGTGMVTVRRPHLGHTAEEHRQTVRAACGGRVFICWLDNYNKFRYSRNPNEDRDRCINASVMAVLPQEDVSRNFWQGWPKVQDLFDQVEVCNRQLRQHHKLFTDRVRRLLDKAITWEQVRVPCDLRRFGVRTLPWNPYALVDADVKSTRGLVAAVKEALRLQRQTLGLCCMLLDVNIFWRVLKMVYTNQYLQCNVRGEMSEVVPVLGIWHAYAHSVKKVYEHYLPLFAALEVPAFLEYPEVSTVYCKPRLIVMEHLVMGMFLAAPQVIPAIRETMQALQGRCKDDSEQMEQCRAMLYLFSEYAPALVEMGICVRQCFWGTQDVNTGMVAKNVLRDAVVLLQSLCPGGSTEYIRNLIVMEMMWGRLHSALPAAGYVEECLESSLSVLARRTRTDTRATTVGTFSDVYAWVLHNSQNISENGDQIFTPIRRGWVT